MKYSVGRESKSGRFVTISRRDGKAIVDVKPAAKMDTLVREETVVRAKKAANTALTEVRSKR